MGILSRRALLVVAAAAIVAVAVYWLGLRGSSAPTGAGPAAARPVAQIGEGKRVVVVAGSGRLLGSAAGAKTGLPVLALKEPPSGGHVRGHVLEEVKILAAAPRPLRRQVARAAWGETGVDVEFTSGIEVHFGDDQDAARKWKAAAAVLADPSVSLLSYVDVHAPTRPTTYGSEHELPPVN